jgi:hypothetical protein
MRMMVLTTRLKRARMRTTKIRKGRSGKKGKKGRRWMRWMRAFKMRMRKSLLKRR